MTYNDKRVPTDPPPVRSPAARGVLTHLPRCQAAVRSERMET
jgi:hypothetical protein